MLKSLNDEGKKQLRLNIKRHRQKLFQYFDNINDTVLKTKIKLDLKDLEKSNLNYNDKSKTALSTDILIPKLEPTVGVSNIKTKSSIPVQKNQPLTNAKVKSPKNRSNVEANRLKTNTKVNIQLEQPLVNVEIKRETNPADEIRERERSGIQQLKQQLIDELNNSSSSEDFDDNISVGSNEDWIESYQIENNSDNDSIQRSSTSSSIELVKQSINDQYKDDYLYYSLDSDIPVSELDNRPNTNKRKRTGKIVILAKPQSKGGHVIPHHRFRKPQDRSLHNAKERACRELIAKKFVILRKLCSYLDSNRRVPSKHSILLAAKKECDLLRHFEKKMVAEKKLLRTSNENLSKRIADLTAQKHVSK